MAWWRRDEDKVELELTEPTGSDLSEDEDQHHGEPPGPLGRPSSVDELEILKRPIPIVVERIPSDRLIQEFENPTYKALLDMTGTEESSGAPVVFKDAMSELEFKEKSDGKKHLISVQ